MYLLLELLNKTKEMNASDLHLTVGLAPTIRCNGKLIQLGIDKLSSNDLERFSREILQEKYDEYIEIGEFDTSYSVEGVGRFRINVFKEKNNDAIAIRVIALKIPTLNELNHPEGTEKTGNMQMNSKLKSNVISNKAEVAVEIGRASCRERV